MMTHWLPQGTVYGTLMNFACEHRALAAQMGDAPYKGAPKAPVPYIKTANTFSAHGSAIALPVHVPQVQMRAGIGIIFQRKLSVASVHSAQAAINYVASVVFLNDLTVPHASFYHPPVKAKCMDGFLGVAQATHAVDDLHNLDSLQITVRINGDVVQTFSLSDAPLAKAGDGFEADYRSLGKLEFRFV